MSKIVLGSLEVELLHIETSSLVKADHKEVADQFRCGTVCLASPDWLRLMRNSIHWLCMNTNWTRSIMSLNPSKRVTIDIIQALLFISLLFLSFIFILRILNFIPIVDIFCYLSPVIDSADKKGNSCPSSDCSKNQGQKFYDNIDRKDFSVELFAWIMRVRTALQCPWLINH